MHTYILHSTVSQYCGAARALQLDCPIMWAFKVFKCCLAYLGQAIPGVRPAARAKLQSRNAANQSNVFRHATYNKHYFLSGAVAGPVAT